jgi:hypothetical protein
MLNYHFGELAIGTVFEFRGRQYRKLALSMTRDDTGCGNIFLAETVVTVEREITAPLPWKPNASHWTVRSQKSVISNQ